jgi:YidC/Oxa1 family membrane protein insertase
MGFDRNTVIGFALLAVLLLGYFFYTRQGQLEVEKKTAIEKARQDSIARAAKPKTDSVAFVKDSLRSDTIRRTQSAGVFSKAANGNEQELTVENDLMKIVFTNKGAQPKLVELKKYKSIDSGAVRLIQKDDEKISYNINTGDNRSAQTGDLYFSDGTVTKNPDGSQTVSFKLQDSLGKSITHQFVIKKDDYMIDFSVQMNGADQLLTNGAMNILWQFNGHQHEKDIKYEKTQTQILWLQDGDYDYMNVFGKKDQKFDKPVNWFSIKQQFFNTTFISKNGFATASIDADSPADSIGTIITSTANLRVQLPPGATAIAPFQLYYGPNDYKILKSYKMEMENIVNLGQGMFAFVKYINRWLIMPVFNFFKTYVGSMGIVILLLTILIRLLISPLTYSSYLSGAKMKALRPEIDALKKKHGSDQQAYGVEQMKLFRTAGVNPLGGCIPALLQIPIFISLYSFFNSSIALRGESFLWAKDLSIYDSILDFGNVPLISSVYGSHISLFTILAVVTSFLISFYNMSMTPDQNNPVIKYMPYIFPVILLGVFNGLPSALTWYYTVSNVITLLLQFIIQKYIINHDKILSQIEDNKKKPKTKTKWQEKLEQVQEAQKKAQEIKNKNTGKR